MDALACDVLVVGARCAGAATAMLMARFGLDVLVVDRARYGSDTLSTHALMRAGVTQLARWGLLEAVIKSGAPAVRHTRFVYDGEVVDVPVRPSAHTDALYAPRRTVLDPILVNAAEASGARFMFSTRVDALTRDASGRVTGARVSHQGLERRIAARLVVGADGARSTVAEQVGARITHRGENASGGVYGYFKGLPEAVGLQWCAVEGHSVGAIPTNHATCVFASIPEREFRQSSASSRALFLRGIHRAAPHLALALEQATPLGALRRAAPLRGFMRDCFGPGWALVGDAGYFKDPITAHGISDALRDAELLARAYALHGEAGLPGYQQARDSVSVELFAVTDTIAAMDWSVPELMQLHRLLSASMRPENELIERLPSPRGGVSPCSWAE